MAWMPEWRQPLHGVVTCEEEYASPPSLCRRWRKSERRKQTTSLLRPVVTVTLTVSRVPSSSTRGSECHWSGSVSLVPTLEVVWVRRLWIEVAAPGVVTNAAARATTFHGSLPPRWMRRSTAFRVSVSPGALRMIPAASPCVLSVTLTGTITNEPVPCLCSVATQIFGLPVESVSARAKAQVRVPDVRMRRHVNGRTAAGAEAPPTGRTARPKLTPRPGWHPRPGARPRATRRRPGWR